MLEELPLSAALLRDLQDERVPLSTIIRRILEWPPVRDNLPLRKRFEWELEGFPEEEEALVKELGRSVKRTGLWEPFFGPVEELERFIQIKEKGVKRECTPPEPGSIFIGSFQPEFLEDEKEIESTKAYLRKLRRVLAEAIVERHFILTNRFMKHFDWML